MSDFSAQQEREITELVNTLNISTREFLIPELEEMITTASVITQRFSKKAKPWNGGTKMEIDLDYGITDPTEMASKYDPIVNQNIDMYEQIIIKRYWVNDNVTMAWLDILANRGKERVHNLAAGKMRAMTRGMKRKHNEMLFRPMGTATVNQMPSFYDWTLNTSTSADFGGLTQAAVGTLFDWLPKVNDLSAETITHKNLSDPTSDWFIVDLVRDMISLITSETDEMPTLGFMPQYIWDAWDKYLTKNQDGTEGKKKSDTGYDYIAFRGVEFFAERYAIGGAKSASDTSVISIVNEEYMSLYSVKGADNTISPWKLLEESKVYRSTTDWVGSFACSRRDVHGSIILPVTGNPA